MPTDTATARDEMLSRLKDTAAGLSTPPGPLQLIYDDATAGPTVTEATNSRVPSWARVRVQHTVGRQITLSDAAGKQRWEQGGFLIIQLFTPALEGQNRADAISSAILNAFRGYSTPSGVWFRNPRSNEVGKDGSWYQTNLYIDFSYDLLS